MTNLIEKTIKQKGRVNIYPIYEYWADMGSNELIKKF